MDPYEAEVRCTRARELLEDSSKAKVAREVQAKAREAMQLLVDVPGRDAAEMRRAARMIADVMCK